MRETQDGFRLAEEDLRLRGGGELLGTRQSGGGLDSERGQAARVLLYLLERDWGVTLLRGG
jgi:ATP-dependent DNA helicase RecG